MNADQGVTFVLAVPGLLGVYIVDKSAKSRVNS